MKTKDEILNRFNAVNIGPEVDDYARHVREVQIIEVLIDIRDMLTDIASALEGLERR